MTTFVIVALSLLILCGLGIGLYVAYTCWKYYGSYELSSCVSKEKSSDQSSHD